MLDLGECGDGGFWLAKVDLHDCGEELQNAHKSLENARGTDLVEDFDHGCDLELARGSLIFTTRIAIYFFYCGGI